MLRRNGTANNKSYLLGAMLGSTNSNYACDNTHSFRIGAATTVRQANILDPLIQLIGRWKSNAYLTYIKTPPMEMAKLSKHLIINYQPPYTTRLSST